MYLAKILLTSTIIKNEYIADIAYRAKRHLEEPAPIYFLLVVILFPSLCSLRLLTLSPSLSMAPTDYRMLSQPGAPTEGRQCT